MSDAAAVEAFYRTWQLMGDVLDGAWLRRTAYGVVGATGLPLPTMNGLWSGEAELSVDEAARSLDDVVDAGLPYCLQCPTSVHPSVAAMAHERGMQQIDDVPLMRATGPVDARADGLTVRQISTAQADLHVAIAAAAFGGPAEVFLPFVSPRVLAEPAVRVYVGEAAGTPVTTGVGVTVGDAVGVFTVGTLPAHQRKGYGAAVTARIVADGLAGGAGWAWLQSSPSGLPVYERLGFRTVDTWQCWVTA
jgi:GNAT superfamily N-acetyltransferase